ncbi:MAG: cytochrome c family protein [Pseudomonadota bacterium]
MSDQTPETQETDPLFSNKIAFSGLTALLLIFGLPQLANAVFGGGHHGGKDEELHLAYCCVELETASGEAGEEKPFDLGMMMANASMPAGERRAALCKSCHSFEEGGPNGTGPNLWNIVGREVASVPGFNYSAALADFGGIWSYERLDGYLKNSQEYVPGTAMVQRYPQDDKRAELLVYLGSLSNNPVPYPEPLAAVAEELQDSVAEEATE